MEPQQKNNSVWIVVALILSVGMMGVALILLQGMLTYKRSGRTIEVVGSARKLIRSDLATWSGGYSVQAANLQQAYAQLRSSQAKVRSYLEKQGLADKDLQFSAVSTTPVFAVLANGQPSNRVESYKLSQDVSLRSTDLPRIDELSRNATELINQGVEFQSAAPQYYYTKIADLKLEVLSAASKDAKMRADKIAENTQAHAGRLCSAVQGVFQITAPNSTEVSGMGVLDTSSIEKEVMAVVICNFEIQP